MSRTGMRDGLRHRHAGRNDRPGDGRERRTDAPFWVTRRAALLAVVATHVAAGLAVLAEVVWPVDAGGYAVKRVTGLDFTASYALYGFVACVLLVLLGIVLRKLVMRDENYYRDGPP